jgi:hypothetical protein
MGIKEIFPGNKFKDKFSFKQKGNIWRFYFNNDFIIVGETRDIDAREFYLFSMNYKSKEIFFKDFSPEAGWWCNICGMNDKQIYLSRYKKPDLPVEKGIVALDLKSGSTLWQNDDLKFYFNDNDNVYGVKELFEMKKICKLDVNSGDLIEESGDFEFMLYLENEKKKTNDLLYKDCIYTESFSLESDTISESLRKHLEVIKSKFKIIGNIDFLNINDFTIYNYYYQKGINLKDINAPVLENVLEIYDNTAGKIVYKNIINNSVSAYVPDSFFIKHDHLMYVKNKNELVIVNLIK